MTVLLRLVAANATTLVTMIFSQHPAAFTIAVDGPAGAGKGTIARRLAEAFGLTYLDTGLLYRAVAATALKEKVPLDNEASLVALAATIALESADPLWRSPAVAQAASKVAALPGVRAALLQRQREVASTPPGAVLDGRDIGTVVCPAAPVKIFLTASAPIRAQRRLKELQSVDPSATYANVLRDVEERDARDAGRSVAPLTPAIDAVIVDTSFFDVDAVVAQCTALVRQGMAKFKK
jgi:cytidylate kinase